jgi:hypothetical protein
LDTRRPEYALCTRGRAIHDSLWPTSPQRARTARPTMNDHELLGYTASGLVLATFWMRSMLALRLLAIASNVAFIAYAYAVGIHPVLVLHSILLPLNLTRIVPALRSELRRRVDALTR